jgi:hypothetical protein
MSAFVLIPLLLISYVVFAQEKKLIPYPEDEDVLKWSYQDFIQNNVIKLEAYSYKVRKNGKVTKKSSLLYKKELDKEQHKIFGIEYSTLIVTHDPHSPYLEWYPFETFYNSKGQILKYIMYPEIEKKAKSNVLFNGSKNEIIYEYDKQDSLVKEVSSNINNYYSISEYTKDTVHNHSIQSKIDELSYNKNGNWDKHYVTKDSLRHFKTKYEAAYTECNYCYSRYLIQERKFNASGNLVEDISYTREGELHTKIYYYYDSLQRIVKKIDSTGWYYTIKPFLETITTYEYLDNEDIIIVVTNPENLNSKKEVQYYKYDKNGYIKSYCYNFGKEICKHYTYTFNNNKMVSVIINEENRKTEIYFTYNSRGLLEEKKTVQNDKIIELIRLYFE